MNRPSSASNYVDLFLAVCWLALYSVQCTYIYLILKLCIQKKLHADTMILEIKIPINSLINSSNQLSYVTCYNLQDYFVGVCTKSILLNFHLTFQYLCSWKLDFLLCLLFNLPLSLFVCKNLEIKKIKKP